MVFSVLFVRLNVVDYKPDESDFVCVFGGLSIILPFQGWDGLHKSYGGLYRFLLGLGPCAYGAGTFFYKFFLYRKIVCFLTIFVSTYAGTYWGHNRKDLTAFNAK